MTNIGRNFNIAFAGCLKENNAFTGFAYIYWFGMQTRNHPILIETFIIYVHVLPV